MNKLDKLFNTSDFVNIDNDSKIVIMSDCHRGAGDGYDNFFKNQNLFKATLQHYYDNEHMNKVDLFKDLKVYESLILKYYDKDIFLLHGHQLDFFNGSIWVLSIFLVRNVWKPLEHLGVKDLTSTGKNYHIAKGLDKKFKKWSIKNNKIIIAGHTHRAVFPSRGDSLYFNDGCCVYQNGITCIEIENGNIVLVRWEFEYKDNMIFASRRQISDEVSLLDFYK